MNEAYGSRYLFQNNLSVLGQTRQVDTIIVDADLLNQKVRLNRELQTSENLNRLMADISK